MMANQRTNMSLALRTTAIAWLVLCVTAAGQTPERSRTQGLKETDRFIKTGGQTSQSVAAAKLQVQTTLSAYNTLVSQPSTNMKRGYKTLLSSMDAMNKAVSEATTKIAAMRGAADTYFGGRAEALKNIQDSSLQQQGQQRMQQNRSEFDAVLLSLRDAGQALEPFRKQLADHIQFLGSDLNASAVASLKPEAAKLNADGVTVFSKADQAMAKANEYFNGLKART